MSFVDFQEILKELNQRPPFDLDQETPFFVTLGKTGSGKSTLLNFLLDFDVKFQKKGLNYILRQPEAEDEIRRRPRIGNDGKSCTEFADLYFDRDKNPFYDCAGYFDTKGVRQEILNGISNSKIFEKGRRVKLILVIDINSLFEARGQFIHEFVQLLRKQFGPDAEAIACSTMIVVSKVSTGQYDLDEIEDYIKELIDTNTAIDEMSKFFLHVIVKNKRIELFPLPNKKFNSYIDKIKKTASSLKETYLTENAKISMSDDGFHFLIKLQRQSESKLNEVSNTICSYLDQLYKKHIQNHFQPKYQTLASVQGSIHLAQTEQQMMEVFNALKVEKELTGQFLTNLSVIEFCLKSSNSKPKNTFLEKISAKISELLSFYQLKLQQNVSEDQKKKLKERLKKAQEELKAKYQRKMEEIKRKQEQNLLEIEKQKEALQNQYQDFEDKQKEKVRKLKQELKRKEMLLEKEPQFQQEKRNPYQPSYQTVDQGPINSYKFMEKPQQPEQRTYFEHQNKLKEQIQENRNQKPSEQISFYRRQDRRAEENNYQNYGIPKKHDKNYIEKLDESVQKLKNLKKK